MADGKQDATLWSDLLAQARGAGGEWTLDVGADWMQGRTVFGGLQAAFALRAMRALVPGIPLRTLQGTFLAPVPAGTMRAQARVLRTGKNATHIEARLVDGGTPQALLVGVFGAQRASAVRVVPAQPAVDASRALEVPYVAGVFPAFTQHFRSRWLAGKPPYTGDTQTRHVIDVSMRDSAQAAEGHVIAIADFMPPVALSHLKSPAPGSTLTWMLEMLAERFDGLSLEHWRVDVDLQAALGGYTSQSVVVWGPGGEPLALSRQSMVVFG